MLTRLKGAAAKYLERISLALYRLGFTPNTITLLGLILSSICVVGALIGSIPTVLLGIVLSSMMDVLDGALARASGKVTHFGSVLDSFSDRVEEFVYVMSLNILGIPSLVSMSVLAVSFLISYLRSLGEKQGLRIEGVGILERGERIVLIVIAIVGLMIGRRVVADIALITLIVLGLITIAQRMFYIWKNVSRHQP